MGWHRLFEQRNIAVADEYRGGVHASTGWRELGTARRVLPGDAKRAGGGAQRLTGEGEARVDGAGLGVGVGAVGA